MLLELERVLNGLGSWLIRADLGLGLLFVVGISMSLSHVFGLFANRLGARQILWRLLIDALVLASAFLCCSISMDPTRFTPVLLWMEPPAVCYQPVSMCAWPLLTSAKPLAW
jgi:hypothetical protein